MNILGPQRTQQRSVETSDLNTTIMATEIAEQPETVAATLEKLLPLRDRVSDIAAGRRHLLFVGRGTSHNAAAYGRYLCETHSGRRAETAAPSVATHYHARLDLDDTVAVCLSQSGRTAEIVETQAWARENGAATIAITNDPDSSLAREADLALITAAGAERAVPATKTYTAQLTALAVLADALTAERGLEADLRRLPESVEDALSPGSASAGAPSAGSAPATSDVDSAARMLASAPRGQLVLGRGRTLTTAWETGLKLEETCLRPVRALSYADFKHGPKAVLDEGIASVVVAPPDGPVLTGLTELARTVAATGSPVLGIGGDDEFARACGLHLPGPDLPEALAPIGLIVTAQLVVEATARELGLDPDQPRGLTKVTQTDPGA